MLIVARFQPRIYSTVNRIKAFWYNFFLAFVPIFVFLEEYFVIDKLSTELKHEIKTEPLIEQYLSESTVFGVKSISK